MSGGDLVEGEGVNAASAESTVEAAAPPAEGDVLTGGDAEAAPNKPDTGDNRDLTGSAPGADDREPGFPAAESGQDSGLMS